MTARALRGRASQRSPHGRRTRPGCAGKSAAARWPAALLQLLARAMRPRSGAPAKRAARRRVAPVAKKVWAATARRWRPRFSPAVARLLGAAQKWRCGLCAELLTASFQIDHRVALAEGGPHSAANAWALCAGCHAEKSYAELQARAHRRVKPADRVSEPSPLALHGERSQPHRSSPPAAAPSTVEEDGALGAARAALGDAALALAGEADGAGTGAARAAFWALAIDLRAGAGLRGSAAAQPDRPPRPPSSLAAVPVAAAVAAQPAPSVTCAARPRRAAAALALARLCGAC